MTRNAPAMKSPCLSRTTWNASSNFFSNQLSLASCCAQTLIECNSTSWTPLSICSNESIKSCKELCFDCAASPSLIRSGAIKHLARAHLFYLFYFSCALMFLLSFYETHIPLMVQGLSYTRRRPLGFGLFLGYW